MPQKPLPSAYAEDAARFGQQVRALREARGWSQDELIKRADHQITKQTLQRIELGLASRATRSSANPQLSTLIALSTVLDARVVIDVNRPSGFVVELESD